MLRQIEPEELNIMETLASPIASAEILFSNMDILSEFKMDKFSEIRKYQIPMLSFDTLFFYDKEKSKRENFEIQKGMAESFNLGGRMTGKSLVSIKIDALLALLHRTVVWGAISSLDSLHLRSVLEPMITALESHPVFKLLKAKINRSPSYKISTKDSLIESVNNNLTGKTPGNQWFGKHCEKIWDEEFSFLTEEVANKRYMAKSELGAIARSSGMSTFTRKSPAGKIFFDLKNKNKLINLPSYVNPNWSNEDDERAINEFGGKSSIGYQIQILGKVIEGCDNVYDIERIRESYDEDRLIKCFEIDKDNFYNYKELVIVDKPVNVDKVYIALDVGEGSAPTEIIVVFKIKEQYVYTYNITTMKLTADEETELLDYLMITLKCNVIGIDTTSGGGKAIASKLTKKYPNNVIWVSFNEKIAMDFLLDEENNPRTDASGKNIYKEEYVTDWSIQRLKQLFYTQKMVIPKDFKFDNQFSNIIAMKSGMRTVYGSKVANHLHQAWQVFAISEWQTEFVNINAASEEKNSLNF